MDRLRRFHGGRHHDVQLPERHPQVRLMEPFSKAKAYCERRHVRPAWRRTLTLYAERLGINVDDFR